jgi:hypothetical protein
VTTPTYEIRLKKNYDVRCAVHMCPVRACHAAHHGEPVVLATIELDRYFHVRRIGERDDSEDAS